MGNHDALTISTASIFGLWRSLFVPVRNQCCSRQSLRQSRIGGSIAPCHHRGRDGCHSRIAPRAFSVPSLSGCSHCLYSISPQVFSVHRQSGCARCPYIVHIDGDGHFLPVARYFNEYFRHKDRVTDTLDVKAQNRCHSIHISRCYM